MSQIGMLRPKRNAPVQQRQELHQCNEGDCMHAEIKASAANDLRMSAAIEFYVHIDLLLF